MSGNTIGQLFRVTTFGESHGIALGCIVDGVPPNMELSEADIQPDLDRRKPGTSRYTTPRREDDEVQILSGIFEGKTTGTSIGMIIKNSDQRSQDYGEIKDRFRPGHADFTYQQKYGIRDYRGGGRSSARETAMRVAAGAIAKKYLRERFGIEVRGFLSQIGNVKIAPQSLENIDWAEVNSNPFFCPDKSAVEKFDELIRDLKKQGDSIGAKVTVVAENVPVGLGEPVFDRLDADLAHALMSINAVKGVEIGDGFAVVEQRGSEHRDEMTPIIATIALKPTSSITIPGRSVNLDNQSVEVVTKGRHDPCVGIRAVPIAEAMMAIVLLDHLLRHKAQCGLR